MAQVAVSEIHIDKKVEIESGSELTEQFLQVPLLLHLDMVSKLQIININKIL